MKKKVAIIFLIFYIIYIIFYFFISTYFSYRYSMSILIEEDKNTIQKMFGLDDTQRIIFLLNEISWLSPKLKAIYIENNKIVVAKPELSETVREQDVLVIAGEVEKNDIIKIFWYGNIINIIILISYIIYISKIKE